MWTVPPFHAEAVVFGTGNAVVDGFADFLADPIPGVQTKFRLEKVPLDNLKSIIARVNLHVQGGIVSTNGDLEHAANTRNLHVAELEIRDIHIDYLHTPGTATAETARKDKVVTAAKMAANRPGMDLRLDRFEIVDSDIGFVNKARTPPYRVFFAGTHLTITNLSNQFVHGPATAQLTGKFMGSGIRVKNGQINGYVKPLFKDMKVYDKRQDAEKSAFRRLYERLVGGIAKLLENRAHDEVATKATISGSVSSPDSSTWQGDRQVDPERLHQDDPAGLRRRTGEGGESGESGEEVSAGDREAPHGRG